MPKQQPRRRTFTIQGQSDDFEGFLSSATHSRHAMHALIEEISNEKVLSVQKLTRSAARLIAESPDLRCEVYFKNMLAFHHEELSKALYRHRVKFNIKNFYDEPLKQLKKYKKHELLKDDAEALALIEECFVEMRTGQDYHSAMVRYGKDLYAWELANTVEPVKWFQAHASALERSVEEAYGNFSGCLTKVFDKIVLIGGILADKLVNLK